MGAPDQRIGVALNAAGDVPPGVLFHNAQSFGRQVGHAEAVVVKPAVGQLDVVGVGGQIVARSVHQPVGQAVDAQGALRGIKPELIVLGGVLLVKGHRKAGVIANAKGHGVAVPVFHLQRVVHGAALQPEGGAQGKAEREPRFRLRPIGQFQRNGMAGLADEPVLQVPRKAMLPACVFPALPEETAAGQLARPGEQDGGVPGPDGRVCLPEHLLPGGIFQADCFGTMGIHGQGQKFVVNGCLHDSSLLFIC